MAPLYTNQFYAQSEGSNASLLNGSRPNANNHKLGPYETEQCGSWEEKGTCRYGAKCQFVHGEDELRIVSRHPKYKTDICRTFWVSASGTCPYGKRCCFIHTELPVSGVAPGAAGPPSSVNGNRKRSNSDPNECSISGSNTKSAFPTFATNALMLLNQEQSSMKSPIALTAGPDLGRHNPRLDIVRYNQPRRPTPSARHSFNRTDVDLNFTTPLTPSAANQASSFTMALKRHAPTHNAFPRSNHVRSGSAGNWGNVTRSSNLTAAPSYPQSSEARTDAPWSFTPVQNTHPCHQDQS
ncbi:hypothetical protein BU15DRAFT_87043 [Melanogaster broomeanus]|nr:hypothetical protein BU15DRAFT_87043 [Melanogaster broomeanus]